jgi:hypothetical protein
VAKRLTDTKLNRRAWFRKLPLKLKFAWRFICDECDHAGIWDIDMEAIHFHMGEAVELSLQEMIDAFTKDNESRVHLVGEDKLFIPGFIEFQYKCKLENLNPENKVHKSIIERLSKFDLIKPLGEPHARGLQGAKEKEKDKDKDKEQDKEKEKEDLVTCGAIEELEGDIEIEQLLKTVSKHMQKRWLKEFGDVTRIKQELLRALQYKRNNPHKGNTPNMGGFLTTWLTNARDWGNKTPPKEAVDPFALIGKGGV